MELPKQSSAIARSPLKLLNGPLQNAPKYPPNAHQVTSFDDKNKPALLPSSALELRLGTSFPPDRCMVGPRMDTQVNTSYVDSKVQPRVRRAKQQTVIVRPPPEAFVEVAAKESGIFSQLNPGIIRRVRDKEEIRASIRAIISGDGVRKRRREEDPGRTLTLALPSKQVKNDEEMSESLSLEGMFMKEEEGVSSGATEASSREEKVVVPAVNSNHNLTSSDLAKVWFKLLSQDVKGRISALKRSRRRVRTAIVAKDESMFLPWNHPSFQQQVPDENVDPGKLKRQYDMQVDKWKSLFVNMDAALGAEASALEEQLKKLQELEVTSTHCTCNAPPRWK